MVSIAEPEIKTYEPSVSDRIQRVLYRLENGDKLTTGFFREDNNFCVLGIFADESGIGKWYYYGDSLYDYLIEDQGGNPTIDKLCEYYNMNEDAMFYLSELEPELATKVSDIIGIGECYEDTLIEQHLISLVRLNDIGVANGSADINDVLAAVIRSGALFRK